MEKTYIDKLGFVLSRDRKALVARSKGKDVWLTPGGKREVGETDEQALMREVEEELALVLDPSTITYYGTFEAQAHGKPEGTMVRITCYTAAFSGEPVASSEIEELKWIDSSQIAMTSVTGRLILEDMKAKDLID